MGVLARRREGGIWSVRVLLLVRVRDRKEGGGSARYAYIRILCNLATPRGEKSSLCKNHLPRELPTKIGFHFATTFILHIIGVRTVR